MLDTLQARGASCRLLNSNERSVQPVEQNVHERTGSKGLFPNFGVPPMASSKGAAYHFSDLIV